MFLRKNFFYLLTFYFFFTSYYAIVHPLRPRQSHRRLLISIGAIWFFSALFSLPTLLYSDTIEVPVGGGYGSGHEGENGEGQVEEFTSLASDYFRRNLSGNSASDSWFPSSLLMNVLASSQKTIPFSENGSTSESNETSFSTSSTLTAQPWVSNSGSRTSGSLDFRFSLDNSQSGENSNFLQPATRTLCLLRWPDGDAGFSRYEFM